MSEVRKLAAILVVDVVGLTPIGLELNVRYALEGKRSTSR
jgi:hypothetical protein